MFGNSHILIERQVMNLPLPDHLSLTQAQGQSSAAPWWLVGLLVVITLLSLLIWWIAERRAGQAAPAAEADMGAAVQTGGPVPAPTNEVEAEADRAVPAAEAPPDNLTRIEGIGPKISEVLQAAGVSTFAGLAQTEVSRIQEILDASSSNFRLADPSTWPEQARLAARGEWDKLEALQDELKGGRRAG